MWEIVGKGIVLRTNQLGKFLEFAHECGFHILDQRKWIYITCANGNEIELKKVS